MCASSSESGVGEERKRLRQKRMESSWITSHNVERGGESPL